MKTKNERDDSPAMTELDMQDLEGVSGGFVDPILFHQVVQQLPGFRGYYAQLGADAHVGPAGVGFNSGVATSPDGQILLFGEKEYGLNKPGLGVHGGAEAGVVFAFDSHTDLAGVATGKGYAFSLGFLHGTISPEGLMLGVGTPGLGFREAHSSEVWSNRPGREAEPAGPTPSEVVDERFRGLDDNYVARNFGELANPSHPTERSGWGSSPNEAQELNRLAYSNTNPAWPENTAHPQQPAQQQDQPQHPRPDAPEREGPDFYTSGANGQPASPPTVGELERESGAPGYQGLGGAAAAASTPTAAATPEPPTPAAAAEPEPPPTPTPAAVDVPAAYGEDPPPQPPADDSSDW